MPTIRTYMMQFPGGEISVQRYTETEAQECFGIKALGYMREGLKATVHFPRTPNVVVIELETTGLARLGLPLDTKVRD